MDTTEPNKANATEKLEEVQLELQCSICHDYFVQASTLSCSHSFCFNCIDAWRQTHADCPVCRREILGMAPSRALDNMVAAFVDRTNSEEVVQASLQQFSTWRNAAVTTPETVPINSQPDTQQSTDSDYDNEDGEDYDEWEDDEEEEESYSDGSYDAEEEENEAEVEDADEEEWEEEEEQDGSYYSNSGDEDDDGNGDEYSDDDEYDEHANRSNQNNPNNEEYWRMRGWSSRPDNWQELLHRQ